MALTLLAGPANAGKVALLLERYLGALDDEPFLIVPNRSDVDRVERQLLATTGALMAGEIGTFDDLFGRLARAGGRHRRPEGADRARCDRPRAAERLDEVGTFVRLRGRPFSDARRARVRARGA